jgi:DNA-binding NtrC family response regulator
MFKKLRILIVDDSETDAFLLNYSISISGLNTSEILVAADLKEALASVNAQAFDVILLDLNLPDSFGIESLHEINKVSGSSMVIIISGNEDIAVAMETIANGAQDFIVKGRFKPEDLFRAINFGLERKKREDHLRARLDGSEIQVNDAADDRT